MNNGKPIMEKFQWDYIFPLDIPVDWTIYEEDGVVSLFDEQEGVGVIQLSLAKRKSPQEPTLQEAVELTTNYALERDWAVPLESIHALSVGDASVAEFSAQENADGQSTYWRVWHIMGRERMAFITYNCLMPDKKVEAKLCDLIIDSFRWI